MNIAFVDGDDWQGLYLDGKLVLENHSLYSIEVLEALKIKFKYIEADGDWMMENGHLPEKLSQVKKAKHH